jgi:hypothetical protein
MNVYYASILCHKGIEVLRLEYTVSAKHSAFLGTQYVNLCPPAGSFKINKLTIDSRHITRLLNQEV